MLSALHTVMLCGLCLSLRAKLLGDYYCPVHVIAEKTKVRGGCVGPMAHGGKPGLTQIFLLQTPLMFLVHHCAI